MKVIELTEGELSAVTWLVYEERNNRVTGTNRKEHERKCDLYDSILDKLRKANEGAAVNGQ